MTVINNVDLGGHPTWNASMSTRTGPVWGAETQSVIVTGGQEAYWSRSGMLRKRTETIWVQSTPPDPVQVLRLVRQLQELANNPNMQPVYIQWASGAGNIIADPEDGWYTLENVTPDEDIAVDGIVPVKITVSYLAPGLGSRAMALTYIGGPTNPGFGGPSTNWLAYPPNSSNVPFPLRRNGAEGYIPTSYQLPSGIALPQLFSPSSTVADLFKGRVAVFDTINTGSFPVPTNGLYINGGWLEVLHPDHEFAGDLVMTNGLLLAIFTDSFVGVCQLYFWNIFTSQWLLLGTMAGNDSGSAGPSGWIIQGWTLGRISHRESSVAVNLVSANNNWARVYIRILSGSHYLRIQFQELSQTNMRLDTLTFLPVVNSKIIAYTDNNVLDGGLSLERTSLPASGAAFASCFDPSASQPCIFGWLYTIDPTLALTVQGNVFVNGIAVGDGFGNPPINGSRFYGFFAAPYPNVQFLQAEAESGVLGTGWTGGTSNGNVNASAGFEAKCASGTAAGNRNIFGSSVVPPTGTYDVWFHMRVAAHTGTTPEMTIGLWDDDFGGPPPVGQFVPGGSVTLAPNSVPTGYNSDGSNWFKANSISPLLPTPGHRMRFRAITAATLSTDWFVDEAVLVPMSMLPSFGSLDGPHDMEANFLFDRVTKVVPL